MVISLQFIQLFRTIYDLQNAKKHIKQWSWFIVRVFVILSEAKWIVIWVVEITAHLEKILYVWGV